ncbi:hypothetical protein [Serratia marcescens]|uniref:hypothetical protein n=1 Tax=Serratia marcescens TaxID=615 RepID=UPI00217714A6|nr:hypothetical protein [Serratia marcescens]CAI1969532.1 Uncharacterised protein [Serratia marcescens]
MSNFNELCKFNAQVEQARQEARSLIRREAVRLVTFYEKWLGLPAPHWVDEHGKHAYVEVGELKNGEFTACAPQAIPVDDDCALTMAVKTAVGSDSDTPVIAVTLRLKLVSAGDAGVDVAVEINNDTPIQVFTTATDEHAYNDVASSMKKHIMKVLQKRYPQPYL